MASGTADLQRDLGGAIMQSILGALLAAGYADRVRLGDRRGAERVEREPVRSRTNSPSRSRAPSATAQQYPQYASRSRPPRKQSFVDGAELGVHRRGHRRSSLGAVLVFFMFPKHDDEQRLLAEYHAEDTAASAT